MHSDEEMAMFKDFVENSEPLTITLNRMTAYALQNMGNGLANAMPQSHKLAGEQQLTTLAVHFFVSALRLAASDELISDALAKIIPEAMSTKQVSEICEVLMP